MPLELWIPGKAVEYHCHLCGADFTDKAKGIRHAAQCVKRHADEIEEATAEREFGALAGPLDKDKDRWAKRRIKEGRRAYNGRGDVA